MGLDFPVPACPSKEKKKDKQCVHVPLEAFKGEDPSAWTMQSCVLLVAVGFPGFNSGLAAYPVCPIILVESFNLLSGDRSLTKPG